jgi:tetratricopeptide (TPR) repeat protein
MQAFVSGQAGVVLLVDGERLASLHADRPDKMVSRSRRDIPFLFRDVTDLEVFEGMDVPKATARLELATAQADGLQLALLLLDPQLPADLRQEAAAELTGLLATPEVTDWIESVLYSQPVPGDGDLAGALGLCRDAGLVRDLLLRLQAHQDATAAVSRAWDQIPLRVFGSSDERSGALAVAVREGLFRDLVLSGPEHSSLEQFRLKSLGNRPFSKVRNHRDILREWLAPIQAGSLQAEQRRPIFEPEPETADEEPTELSAQSTKSVLERIEKQKAAIVGLMRHDLERARQYLADLIEFQLSAGEPVHACKSLCDLAKKAKDLGLFRFQLELTSQAIALKNDDGWSWTQHGDALLQARQLGPALAAYERALTYVNDPQVQNGRAEVLKAQNRLPEALAAYEAVVADFPENVVARNGRADVLKAQNRLPEALAAYEAVVADFPENVVARNGRAEVLKAQNRLPEALAAYETVVADFPENVVARTGRAEVLKAQNRLPEALAAYETVVADFPADVVARNGCAGVLSALGRFAEALARLPDSAALPVTRDEWIGFHIRAMVLLQMGKAKEAARILRRGISECPVPTSRAYFQTGLALTLIRQRAFAEAEATLEGLEEETRLAAPAAVLRFHAFGAAGNRDRASRAAERLTAFEHVVGVLEVGRELRRRFLDGVGPLETDDWLLRKEVSLLLAA